MASPVVVEGAQRQCCHACAHAAPPTKSQQLARAEWRSLRVFMRRERRNHGLSWLCCLLLWGVVGGPVHAATVLSVGDGDTIRVREAGKVITIRLACIDAPEMSQRPDGLRSRSALSRLVPIGSEVSLRALTVDRYGRTVAELLSFRGNINQWMVVIGQAFVDRKYLEQCDAQQYLSLQRQAQNTRVGVWSSGASGITRPWDYRRSRRGGQQRTGSSRRWRCADIGSWHQAQRRLTQGHAYLDGDGDGEACESLR